MKRAAKVVMAELEKINKLIDEGSSVISSRSNIVAAKLREPILRMDNVTLGKVIEELLSKEVDYDLSPAFSFAARVGNLEALKLLLKKKKNVDIQFSNNLPIREAVRNKQTEVVSFLFDMVKGLVGSEIRKSVDDLLKSKKSSRKASSQAQEQAWDFYVDGVIESVDGNKEVQYDSGLLHLFAKFETDARIAISKYFSQNADNMTITEDDFIYKAEEIVNGSLYDVIATCEGAGVGLWEPNYEKLFKDEDARSFSNFVKSSLSKYIDQTGGGKIAEKVMELGSSPNKTSSSDRTASSEDLEKEAEDFAKDAKMNANEAESYADEADRLLERMTKLIKLKDVDQINQLLRRIENAAEAAGEYSSDAQSAAESINNLRDGKNDSIESSYEEAEDFANNAVKHENRADSAKRDAEELVNKFKKRTKTASSWTRKAAKFSMSPYRSVKMHDTTNSRKDLYDHAEKILDEVKLLNDGDEIVYEVETDQKQFKNLVQKVRGGATEDEINKQLFLCIKELNETKSDAESTAKLLSDMDKLGSHNTPT